MFSALKHLFRSSRIKLGSHVTFTLHDGSPVIGTVTRIYANNLLCISVNSNTYYRPISHVRHVTISTP